MTAKVGDVYCFEYPREPQFNCSLRVVRVDGNEPENLVHFDDLSHSKQKDLVNIKKIDNPNPEGIVELHEELNAVSGDIYLRDEKGRLLNIRHVGDKREAPFTAAMAGSFTQQLVDSLRPGDPEWEAVCQANAVLLRIAKRHPLLKSRLQGHQH